MWEDLLNRLDSLGSPRVLVVGDFMLDRYLFGEAERISPEAPVPILRVHRQQDGPGGAGSVAGNLAALDAQVACCGVVGADSAGRGLLDLLSGAGVDVSGIVRAAGRPTTEKTRVVGLTQHRHPQQIARIDAEDVSPFDAALIDEVLARAGDQIGRADVVVLQDHQKGMLAGGICERIIELARDAGKPVLADPALVRDYRKYRGVTCITPNRFETEEVLGRRLTTDEDVADAAAEMIQHCDADAVIITLDEQGAFLAEREGSAGLVPTTPQPVVDGTGAGDVVLATLALAAGAGWAWRDAVKLANVGAGLEVRKYGAVPITRDEIAAELLAELHAGGGKIRAMPDLRAQLRRRSERGQRIVFTNGCFDILHPGHVHLFRQCKQHGDVLVVGLNSDASVCALGKGPNRPINRQDDRATVLAALEAVDYVVMFDEPDPLACIRGVGPDVLVKGEDWRDKGVIGREFVESRGGEVVLVDLLEGHATTRIIERLAGGEEE